MLTAYSYASRYKPKAAGWTISSCTVPVPAPSRSLNTAQATITSRPYISKAIQEAGIGGFGISSPADLAFAFDYASTGRQDYLIFYRPGTGFFLDSPEQ
jgi:hypothetical protein